jgi:hypothetical protein
MVFLLRSHAKCSILLEAQALAGKQKLVSIEYCD